MPDAAGVQAARRILVAARQLTEDDRLLALVSGGGSSLLALAVDGVPIEDLRAITGMLLHCGAPIAEVNIVRKHLSQIQGGWLAANCEAQITTLIISDVAGDDPSAIASRIGLSNGRWQARLTHGKAARRARPPGRRCSRD